MKTKKSRKRKPDYSVKTRKVMIIVVSALILLVVIALICGLVFNNEAETKRKLDAMANEYYEEFIYENLIHGAMAQDEIESAMSRYVEQGFSSVNLRQLLLYDNKKNVKEGEFVKRFCDENRTSVKFYPIAPFGKKDYRVEYQYKCEW